MVTDLRASSHRISLRTRISVSLDAGTQRNQRMDEAGYIVEEEEEQRQQPFYGVGAHNRWLRDCTNSSRKLMVRRRRQKVSLIPVATFVCFLVSCGCCYLLRCTYV
jgi:hypothetical protein